MHQKAFADKDLYAELGLSPNAGTAEIQTAYWHKASIAHPNNGGSTEAFHSITFAFEVLSCPASRCLYDRARIQQMYQHRSCFEFKYTDRPPAKAHKFKHKSKQRVISTDGLVMRKMQKRLAPNSVTIPAAKRQRCINHSQEVPQEKKALATASSTVPAVNNFLERLRVILQSMTKDLRHAAIMGMDPCVRSALLAFMGTPQQQPVTMHSMSKRKTVRKKCANNTSFSRGTDVRSIKRLHVVRYQAQLRMQYLRVYACPQADIEIAIKHQIIFTQIRQEIDGAGEGIWKNPDQFCRIFNNVLMNKGTSERKLGLSVFVCMRADRWIDRSKTINSPVMALADAVAVHLQLLQAEETSWECLRAAWVALMLRTRHAQAKRLSMADAEAVAENARQGLLQCQFAKALHDAQWVLSGKKCSKVKAHAKLAQRDGS